MGEKMKTAKRLDQVYKQAEILYYDGDSRFVLMSDCHRGVGNWGDNFQPNQNLFFSALDYYRQNHYTYIELGDGDELWENRSMKDIIRTHSNQFWLMAQLYEEGRLYMLFGNHDRVKSNPRYTNCHCNQYYLEADDSFCPLFPDMKFHEGLILEDVTSGNRIFLVHGNQGDFLNDTAWKLGRFLVRYLWRGLELAGILDPTSSAKNYKKKKRTEEKLADWAGKKNVILTAGHTHRPVLPPPGKGMYWNDGSCVHPRCITAMEIDQRSVCLVKWSEKVRGDRILYVDREILAGPYPIADYFILNR